MSHNQGYGAELLAAIDNDQLYEMKQPSSARRYQPTQATPRTVMRVTRHEGAPPPIARASRMQTQTQEPPVRPAPRRVVTLEPTTHPPIKQPRPQGERRRTQGAHHTSRKMILVGSGIGLFAAGALLFTLVPSWLQNWQDDQAYGYPRTYQTDAVVGHHDSAAHPSHFIALNLQDHTQVIEIPGGDPTKEKVYLGPILSPSNELQPVTVTFEHGDGHEYMILSVADLREIFVSDNGTFRPLRAGEHANV